MKSVVVAITFVMFFVCAFTGQAQTPVADANAAQPAVQPASTQPISLGEPNFVGTTGLETAIAQQKNVTKFTTLPLETPKLRQLAWAGQNIIDEITQSPSPENSITPINLYFCLSSGVYRYNPTTNALDGLGSADVRKTLAGAARSETALQEAPCIIVIAGSTNPSGNITREQIRGMIMLAAGRITQNIQLEAQSIGLGTLGIGSFDIGRVRRLAKLSPQQEPAYIIAVGYPAGSAPAQAARKQQQRVLLVIPSNPRPNDFFDTMDVLGAAGIKTIVAQSGQIQVRAGKGQRYIEPDMRLQDAAVNDYDAVLIFGGAGNPTFLREQLLLNIIRTAVRQGKVVGATGETTAALVNAGVLNGITITGDKRVLIRSGGIYTGNLVESDRGIVTALNEQQASLFARAVIAVLKGENIQPLPTPPTGRQPIRQQTF